jgi:hypothetical protein
LTLLKNVNFLCRARKEAIEVEHSLLLHAIFAEEEEMKVKAREKNK